MTTDKSPILIRVQPRTKDALKKAASDQERSVSFVLDKMAVEWLRQNGYLPKAKPKKPPKA